ncbi:hypothetical protein [Streptomyces sp. FL07-04A]|uniref:hypothetical protein n=1 Tax=Streptomyces sp. FL07-04A TaxID=3028658 RepID=UPI00299FB763|nr:hypothetical protein [Streptomyces sp. FL07-04A]MDX3575619.1 hypothetical protein [Streptomyces sp. FL07-04A]
MNVHLDVKRAAATTTAALLVLGLGGGVASADDIPADTSVVVNTEPPRATEPADTDVVDVPASQVNAEPDIPGNGDSGPGNHPGGQICDRTAVYTPTAKGKDYHVGIGAPNANHNGTSHTARSSFTAEASGTVGISISAGLSITIEAMIGKIEQKYNVDLSASLTAKLGNNMQVDTPAHKTTHATYGVYRLRSQGTSYVIYSNCQTSAKKTITSYTPHYVGWYMWETN